jgi:predicted lipoprotein with Yx(FWY)xxD motif
MSKNNPAKRGKAKVKTYNDKPVKPVLYVGSHVGHGKYIAVQFDDGKMAEDKNGKPLMWDAV